MSEEAKQTRKDKRSETSKANMQKALAARKKKFEMRKQEREAYTIESSSESEDSESDGEIVIKARKKGKGKPAKNDSMRQELDELKQAILQMNKKQRKPAKKEKKKIIQIVPPTPQPQPTKQNDLDAIKQRILLQF